jgi:hypothetical protein
MLDRFPLTSTRITLHLHLLEDSWSEHVFLYGNSMSTTYRTCVNNAVRTASAFTLFAYLLFLKLKLGLVPIVEIRQRNRDADFHIRPAPLSRLVPKMSTATKESTEEIEGVVVLLVAALPSLLGETFMAILVVDFP